MAKKKEEVVETVVPEMAEEKVLKVTPFGQDLGRQDLNDLVNKVNEIISHLNA